MLTLIRRKRFRLYVKLVFGLVAFVFIIGFALDITNVGQQKAAGIAAHVNDIVITRVELERIYRNEVQRRFSQLTADQRRSFNLPRQVLDDLIETRLLLSQAPRLGLPVGAEELRAEIQERPYFQDGGRFSMEKYRRIIQQQLRTTPADFESAERENLAFQKVQGLLTAVLYIPAEQVSRGGLNSAVQVNVEVLEVDAEVISKSLKATEGALKAHFEAHKDGYLTEERRSLEMVKFATQDEAQKAVEAIGERQDLAAVAKEQGWTVQTPPAVTREGTIEGVTDASSLLTQAFILEKGTIGPPAKAGDAFHLIRVADVQAPRPATFDEARAKVETDWRKAESEHRAARRAEALLAQGRKSGGLGKLKAEGVSVYETGLFAPNNPSVPHVGASEVFKLAALRLRPEKPWAEAPIKEGRKWYLLRLVERRLPTAEEWPQKVQTALDDLNRLKRIEFLEAWRKTLRDASKIEINEEVLNDLS
ncbi:MAG: SurA N-terminal domain-containing protein [Nitrospirae bacterium]|nr:SurA N-terminal domain-containing protein [Nitrospirota bacterium]